MAWAGWAGLLVTALNLIPVGQLDGGHTLYVLFGEKARRVFPVIVIGLGLLGLVWAGWWLWVMLIFFFGQRHAEPLDQITKLDSRRRAVAIFVLILFFLLFTPIPLTQYGAASAGL
jgi:membrane-associated protease RseP (regulator of RpoE activity)